MLADDVPNCPECETDVYVNNTTTRGWDYICHLCEIEWNGKGDFVAEMREA